MAEAAEDERHAPRRLEPVPRLPAAGRAVQRATRYGLRLREAITFSARPGHSEHQLGLTIDFVAVGDTGLTSNWEATPTGAWMAQNAWKYGWLMSYPKGKKALTCYSYEPWHYRYVGRDLAEKIHDSGLTTREYLWANFTQVDVSGRRAPPNPSADPVGRIGALGVRRSAPDRFGDPAPSRDPDAERVESGRGRGS